MNKLRLGTPRNIAEFIIIPVERINISSHNMKRGVWLYGSKEIAALVIYTPMPYRVSAFNIDGQELSIEELASEVPDLEEFLEKFSRNS